MLFSLTIVSFGILVILPLDNDIPDYKVQTTEWNVENKGWITEDTDKMFYKIEDK